MLHAAEPLAAGLDPTVQVAMIGGIVTILSLVLSVTLDRAFRSKRPQPAPAVPLPPDAADDQLVANAVRRLDACEAERDRLRRVYAELRDQLWAHGINPDTLDPMRPRPRPGGNA